MAAATAAETVLQLKLCRSLSTSEGQYETFVIMNF